MKKILITDEVHPVLIENFEAAGYSCDYFTHYTNKEVRQYIHLYHGIIVNSKINIDKEVLDKAIHLQFIGRLGSGMEIIDKEYATAKGVRYYNSPEGNRDAVGEHAIGMLLALFNNLLKADKEVRNFDWRREENRGLELKGKTVALLGYGNTGKVMAQKLSGFEVQVLAYDKYLENYSDSFVIQADMDTIFAAADIVSLHLPLTPETHYLVDQNFINQFQKPIFLINTSRGKIVKTEDLINALDVKKILGACLDVFENERPESYTEEEKKLFTQLFNHKNVILSPHIAGWTRESKYKLARILSEKILSNH
jgi:D-3-phosphoglycerate dehydrogenase / 2-oxoglutarate reductase